MAGRGRRARFLRVVAPLGVGASFLLAPGNACAQNATILVAPVIDPQYNRDRNIAVVERAHPEFSPLGIRLASFVIHPALSFGPTFSDNVYLDNNNRRADVYARLQPFLTVDSDWSNHRFGIIAAGDIRRYAHQILKNQNAWYVYSKGQLVVRRDATVDFDAQIDRSFESPYSDDVAANLTAPSTYLRKSAAVKATYQPGRTRLIAAVDVNTLRFSTIRFGDGTSRDQAYRNRTIARGSGVYEYALSPSISVFGQAVYDNTAYQQPLFLGGLPNRSSSGFVVSGGSNFDLAGLARGSIGIGYSRRAYNASAVYAPAQGLSAEAKIELFPSPLTTVAVTVQRQLQDANLGNGGAAFNNQLFVKVDHEVRADLVVSGSAEIDRREYFESNISSLLYQFRTSVQFKVNRRIELNGDLSYGASTPKGTGLGNPFTETHGSISMIFRG